MNIKKLVIGGILALAITLIPMGVSANHTASHTIEQLQAQLVALQTQLNNLLGNQTVPNATCSFTRSLSLGSVGEDVKCLQKYLNGTSYKVATSGVGSLGSESNYYGSLTQKAVSAWQAGNGVSPAVGFFGPLSQAKYNSLVFIGTPVETPPVVVNVAKLTSGTPESMTITKNASNFKMMEVKFDGNGSVNSLTVKRLGFGSTSDYKNDGVYLYKDGVRLAEVRSFNSDAIATFNNLNLQAPFTLAVMADFDGTTGNIAKVELRGGYNGLPLQSNNFTFAGVESGVISFSKTGSLTNPVVGQKNAQVSEFKVSNIVVDGETAVVKHIELFNAGDNVLSNVKITDGTNTWSGTTNGDRLVFDVNTSIKSEKSKTFKVYADISGDEGDEIKLYVENTYDIQATGDTYGFGVVVNTSSFDNASESHILTLSESGDLSVQSKSTSDVMGYWGQTVNNVAKFRFEADDSEGFLVDELTFVSDASLSAGAEKISVTYKNKNGNILTKTELVEDTGSISFEFDSSNRPYVAKDSELDVTVGLVLRNDEDSTRLVDYKVVLDGYKATGESSGEEVESQNNETAINGVWSNGSSFVLSKKGNYTLSPGDDVEFTLTFNSDDKVSAFSSTSGGIELTFNYASNSTSFDDVDTKVYVNGQLIDQTFTVVNASGVKTVRLTEDDVLELSDGEEVDVRVTFDLTDFSYDDGDRFSVEVKDLDNQVTWTDDFDGDNELLVGNVSDLSDLPVKFIYKD